MSENIVNHLLQYKTADGKWVALPVGIINIYDVYCAECAKQSITPVDKPTYYTTLGNLETYVTALAGSTNAIKDLITAIEGGNLPLSKGGLGQSFTDEAALIKYFRGLLSVGGLGELGFINAGDAEEIATIVAEGAVAAVASDKLNVTDITYGTAEPETSTPGTFYFQCSDT